MIFDRVFLKYCISGVINTLCGLALMFLLYNIAGLGYWFSSAANETLAGIIGFLINKHWTFKVKRWSLGIIAAYIATIALSYLSSYFIARKLIYYILHNMSEIIRDNAALFTGLCIFSIVNYLGQRFFVFKHKEEHHIIIHEEEHRE